MCRKKFLNYASSYLSQTPSLLLFQTPGLGHLIEKKLFDEWFHYFPLFHRRLHSEGLLIHIYIIIMKTKKNILHRALLFIFMIHKTVLSLEQIT